MSMSTRSGRRTGKSKGSDRSGGWSDWVWDEGSYLYYRTRLNSKGKYDYEYDERGQVPRGATISEDIAVLPNTATAHSPEYFGNQAYEYQGSSQTSSAVEDLSGQFAQTSLNEPVESNAPESTPYNAHQLNEEQVGEVNSNDFVATQPIPIPPNPSRAGYEASTRDYSPSSARTVVGRHSVFADGRSPLISSGYAAPTSSFQYPPQQLPYGAGYDNSYDYPGPSMVDANGTPIPIAGFSETSRGYAKSQSDMLGTHQTYNLPAETSSGAITPRNSHMTIKGTPGSKETLDPRFKVHHSKHFEFGQVFKVLWFEPRGQTATDSSVTEVTDFSWEIGDRKYGQRAHSSIRRFVIVAADNGHCQCLPILTYQRQATKKWGVKRDDHAIIYTGDNPPRELNGEPPLKLRPIRVIGKTPRDKLEEESRINYAKVYTVEHNVKVHFIGSIAPSSQHRLVADFDATWVKKRQINLGPPSYSSSNTIDSSQYPGGGY